LDEKNLAGLRECQSQYVSRAATEDVEDGSRSLSWRMRQLAAQRISYRTKRAAKRRISEWVSWFSGSHRKKQTASAPPVESSPSRLKTGDTVQVRSEVAIRATLDCFNELKGCAFAERMWAFCDTTQRVLKPVERFMNERDYAIKKCAGVFLLEGAICEGSSRMGRCDRACFYFWREEWLEKAECVDSDDRLTGDAGDGTKQK
jgi:hypothetical protein